MQQGRISKQDQHGSQAADGQANKGRDMHAAPEATTARAREVPAAVKGAIGVAGRVAQVAVQGTLPPDVRWKLPRQRQRGRAQRQARQ